MAGQPRRRHDRLFRALQCWLLGTLVALSPPGCGDAPGDASPSSGADGGALGQAAMEPSRSDSRPPLIVITLDTTRADHLSCYGYPVTTTPALDRRAKTALRFERAYAPMAQTLPSHASLFTGLGPRQHGVTDNHRSLPASMLTLAERLSAAGYDTAGFVASAVLQSESGIAQGFDHFDESHFDGSNARHVERDAAAVTAAALSWLGRRDGERPLFLWVHYFDPHLPYEAPEALMHALEVEPIVALLAERAANLDASRAGTAEGSGGASQAVSGEIVVGSELPDTGELRLDSDTMALYWRAYDAEIRYIDHHLAKLFDGLRARGLVDDAVVLVVGDHGEGLFQHGERGHGVNLFEELVRVPLLLWSPGAELAGQLISEPVALADLHDVLLQLCLGEEAELSGATLWDELMARGEPRPAPIFLERPHYSERHLAERAGKDDPGRYVHGEMCGVVAGSLKFIVDARGREWLFDLSSDPDELLNLALQRPEDVERLRGLLDGWRAAHPLGEASDELPELSEGRREALLQLGYGH